MPQLDVSSFIYQFCWAVGGLFLVLLVFCVLPKFLYREWGGALKRKGASVDLVTLEVITGFL